MSSAEEVPILSLESGSLSYTSYSLLIYLAYTIESLLEAMKPSVAAVEIRLLPQKPPFNCLFDFIVKPI